MRKDKYVGKTLRARLCSIAKNTNSEARSEARAKT